MRPGGNRELFNGYRESVLQDEKVLEMGNGDVYKKVYVFNTAEHYT